MFEAAQERVSPTLVRDRQCAQDGVDRVDGAARGAVFRQVGSDPRHLDRIARELSGHYLMAFEALDGDRDARSHRIRVAMAAGRGSWCAPAPVHDARDDTTGAWRAAERRCYANLSIGTELPLRVATYTYAEPGGDASAS